MKKEMVVTSARIEANHLNATKSTGPRTRRGKANSKMNAVKYGLFAGSVIIRAFKFQESAEDFKALSDEFYQSLAPVGPMEEALVDRIIMVLWRQRRLHTAESGEIAKAINHAQEGCNAPRRMHTATRPFGREYGKGFFSEMLQFPYASYRSAKSSPINQTGWKGEG
jgi:hypothetical protein